MSKKLKDGSEVMKGLKRHDGSISSKVEILESCLPAYGINVKVQEVFTEVNQVTFRVLISVGTLISDIEKLDKEITMMLEASDMVKIVGPVFGSDLVEIVVPVSNTSFKKNKFKIIRIKDKEPKLSDWMRIRIFVYTLLDKIGDLFHWLAYKLL